MLKNETTALKQCAWVQRGKKEIAAHRIYLNMHLVTIPMFHVFPNKEHAITRSGLLQDIYEWSA
jgi:hypothetical protein